MESTTLEGDLDERIYYLWSKITNRALLANFQVLRKFRRDERHTLQVNADQTRLYMRF